MSIVVEEPYEGKLHVRFDVKEAGKESLITYQNSTLLTLSSVMSFSKDSKVLKNLS